MTPPATTTTNLSNKEIADELRAYWDFYKEQGPVPVWQRMVSMQAAHPDDVEAIQSVFSVMEAERWSDHTIAGGL